MKMDAALESQIMPTDMRREFQDREELVAYLREQFPGAEGDAAPQIRGGRVAAEALLERIEPRDYARTRSYLGGAVTRLSAALRYGVLGLADVRDAVLGRVRRPAEAAKLVQELAWRDYWQRVYAQLGQGVWQDREPYKTGYRPSDYAAELPDDLRHGATGLPCIDAFVAELKRTGYLHNHSRMWLAAYVVHWRRVRWQAGAAWFLEHLLDGDPASNNLSWQWVASTFSHKPYIFNRENLERFTEGAFCGTCPLYGRCTFEGSYEAVSERLFPDPPDAEASRSTR
jgi:deoxyribodipyrimidine photo-lyase